MAADLSCSACDPRCEEDITTTFNLNVFNFAPFIKSMTVPSTATCPGTIAVQGQATDDDGTFAPFPAFYWTATGPGGVTSSSWGASARVEITAAGTWQIRLDVDDDEGERSSQTRSLVASPGPFTSAIHGAASVPVLRVPIALQVTSNACGTPTTTWDIVQTPPDAHLRPKDAYATGPTLGITTTTDGDIGTWVFRATTTLAGYSGEPVRLETKVLKDDDGGALTFDWKLVQAPASAGVVPGTGFSSGPLVTLPTTAASAGTWIFELTVTDDDGVPSVEPVASTSSESSTRPGGKRHHSSHGGVTDHA